MTDTNLSLQEIFDAAMSEEPVPNREAMIRWQTRYPKYSRELQQFFMTWALQEIRAHRPDVVAGFSPRPVGVEGAEEESVASHGVERAMEIMRKQGRIVPMAAPASLKAFDQLVLTAVQLLGGAGDEVDVTAKVSEIAGKRVLLGSTYVALSRLEDGGLVSARLEGPEEEPDHEKTKYFAVTLAGERALAHAQETSKAVAEFQRGFA